MAEADIPILVKHCALAIYEDGYVKGSKIHRVLHSFNIARGRLTEYGFLKAGSDAGPAANIELTAKGLKSESKHKRELGSKHATKKWDRLYALLEETTEEQDDDAADAAADAVIGAMALPTRDARLSERKRRVARAAKHGPRPRTRRAKKARKATARRRGRG